MKKFSFLFLCSIALSFGVFAQKRTTEVGILENGRAILTVDKENLLRVYNANLLKFSQIDAKLTDVNLVPTDRGNYLLVFTSDRYKSSVFVKNENGRMMAENSTSCTTSDPGCKRQSDGCIPEYAEPTDVYAYCTDCANNGTCTKTITSGSLLN